MQEAELAKKEREVTEALRLIEAKVVPEKEANAEILRK